MNGKIIFLSLVVFLFVASIASANPDIEIQPTAPSAFVNPDGSINVPVGSDAFNTIGLAAYYFGGWNIGNAYSVWVVRDSDGVTVWNHAHTLGLPSDNYLVEIHWIPANDLTETYTVNAEGTTSLGRRTWKIQATAPLNPTPELPTSALMSVGLIGLLGMVYMRRKN